MSGTFAARYGGPCAAECGSRIYPGDDVEYVDDELVHADCADDPPAAARPAPPPCPACWTVHAGECM